MTGKRWLILSLTLLFCGGFSAAAFAQRGMGDPMGIARQGLRPELVELSGTLTAIETKRCERTTGGGVIGTHLVLTTKDGKALNIHLGWAEAVKSIVDKLRVGDDLTVTAFRTDRMPEGQFVAKSLKSAGQTFELRDDALRPFWAGRGAAWQAGRGPGRGLGPGLGPRRGRGGRWGRW